MDLAWLALAVGALAMFVVAYLAWSITKEPVGTQQMREIAGFIEDGTRAFIRRQYRTIAIIIILAPVPLALFFKDITVVTAFMFGAFLAALVEKNHQSTGLLDIIFLLYFWVVFS
jgi:K(+)-stimulated pyrophosphate-energized sodium pump